jgi:hypothetical protein
MLCGVQSSEAGVMLVCQTKLEGTMKSELEEAGLYAVERSDGKCAIETRVCNSYLFLSVVVAIIFGLLAFSLMAIVWLLPKLPASALPIALIGSIPAVVYWWRMPSDWAKRLALFGRRLELDRETEQIQYTEIWVFGFRRSQSWRFNQIAEVVRTEMGGFLSGLILRFECDQSVVLDGENFEIPGLLKVLEEFIPSLRVH